MQALGRTFAVLLFFLSALVVVSMLSTWHLKHAVATSFLNMTTHLASLLICAVLCYVGMRLELRARREMRRREEAETRLKSEQIALEQRIEERTSELLLEVAERRRAEDLVRGHKLVLEMLAAPHDESTEAILEQLARTLAAQRRSWDCAIHRVDASRRRLELVAVSAVDPKLRRYLVNIGTDFPDAPEAQACSSGQIHIVERLRDIHRPWSELLLANGVQSAWSIPFHSHNGDRVAGTVTVYCHLRATPVARDLEMMETGSRLAALVVEHRRIHDELVQNAYQDVLTCIKNRRAGERALSQALEQARQLDEPLSVFWIDVDRFKRINDQHGHRAGDDVLRAVAFRLSQHPDVGDRLARMGGDEFLVLIPGRQIAADPGRICEQFAELISAPIPTSAGLVSITASIGVSSFPEDGTMLDTLERNADFAMYRAKSTGAGYCIFSPTLDADVHQLAQLEEALENAVEREHLRLVYQPIYEPGGGLKSFEALLRFRHPDLGEISPAHFIPLAEQSGQILAIGEWVLAAACRQLHTWMRDGAGPVRVCVNISAHQISRSDFADTVAATLATNGVPASLLTLELTETAVMSNYACAIEQMQRLKAYGISIALDDFGTGYSSLSNLHKLPIDVLKIDRSFTERLTEVDGTRPIVEAIIAMARHLGVYVVAEGVETRAQAEILSEAGCHALQGFLLSRPLPVDDASRRLNERRTDMSSAAD